jgi:hypothetical protein
MVAVSDGKATALIVVRRSLLTIACAAAAWAVALTVFGGVNARVLGILIRSNNPRRVAVIALVALAGYVLAGGRIRRGTLRRVAGAASALLAGVIRRPGLVAVAVAAAFTALAMFESTRIAGGADAYGYVSQAELWLARDLVIAQPWVADVPWPHADWSFAPLGYRPAGTGNAGDIVPTYAPGLPLILAAAKLVGGQCALFAVVPLLGGLAVLATFGIGRLLVTPWAGVAAAFFVATSPTVLGVSFEALSDVPAMGAWAMAFYLLIARPGGGLGPLLAGLLAAVAILIRPNLVPLALPMGAWYLVRRRTASESRLVPCMLFALGALPGVIGVAILNDRFYGSPLASGYGELEDLFAWANIEPNLRRYVSWFAETQTPIALAGIAALTLPVPWLWRGTQDRRILWVIAAFVAMLWGQYFAYHVWEHQGFLRFLLPSWPFIMVGLAAVIVAVHARLAASRLQPIATAVMTLATVLLGAWTFATAARGEVFGQWRGAQPEAPLGQLVRKHTVENSVVLVWERSGTIRYYSGRTTLRYDFLEEDWLDRAVTWLAGRGVHVYAVLDPNHVEQCRRRFAGQKTLDALNRPVFLYEPARTALYDLTTPPGHSQSLILYEKDPGGRAACDPPATATPITLR